MIMSTLKGVFNVPKDNHRRNFLRENKLSLRDLQKLTTEKVSKAKDHQSILHRQRELHKLTNEAYINSYYNHKTGSARIRQQLPNKELRLNNPRKVSAARKDCKSIQCTNTSSRSLDAKLDLENEKSNEIQSIKSYPSQTLSCDKEIQTEDINDEEFLYQALKKCSATDVEHCPFKTKITNKHKNAQSSTMGYENQKYGESLQDKNLNSCFGLNSQIEIDVIKTPSSINSSCKPYTHKSYDKYTENFNLLSLNDDDHNINNYSADNGISIPLSVCSTQRNNFTKGEVALHSTKEKTQNDTHRPSNVEHDLNCPAGYYLLKDEQRTDALAAANKKFNALVKEWNCLPMTTETLRVRKRKADIEKLLSTIEADIRFFSKHKVYMKLK